MSQDGLRGFVRSALYALSRLSAPGYRRSMPGRVSPDIAVVVPTRGRPRSVGRLLAAWHATCAFDDGARLVLAVDSDDPASTEYEKVLEELQRTFPQNAVSLLCTGRWQPLVPKLNRIARLFVDESFALGFMGDDHLPRTVHWVRIVGGTLSQMGTGIVYGNDLLQGKRLPTAWIMTSDIVGVLGAMVPAPVEHLYCDDTILALGREARCIQ